MASRKNHTLKLAGILLALVLVTSCFVGGTFAKYVTEGTGSDSARVAKFGVKVTANGSTFANAYATDDNTVTGIANSVVSSEETKNVVAPGTSGNMVSMTLAGTPEVAVNVKYAATVTLKNWVYKANESATEEFYCPLVITVNGEDIKGLNYPSDTDFKNAIETKINAYSNNYAAKTSLGEKSNDSLKVSWAWAFEDNAADATQTDVKDTYLGDQAAKGNAATIALEVVTTVTQID